MEVSSDINLFMCVNPFGFSWGMNWGKGEGELGNCELRIMNWGKGTGKDLRGGTEKKKPLPLWLAVAL